MKPIYLLAFVMLISCNGYHYVAPPCYVPVNQEKGSLTTNFSYNYVQIGYTFSNHLSAFTSGNYNFNSEGIFSDSSSQYSQNKNFIAELNAGFTFYSKLGNLFSCEVVTGMGKGIVNYTNLWQVIYDFTSPKDYSFSLESDKISLFIQPNLSFKPNQYIDLSFFTRINYNRYYNVNSSLSLGNSSNSPNIFDKFFHGKSEVDLYFIEPGIQFRGGGEKFKFSTQVIITNSLQTVQYRTLNFYLGGSFTFMLDEINEE